MPQQFQMNLNGFAKIQSMAFCASTRAHTQAISWHMTKPYQHEFVLAHVTMQCRTCTTFNNFDMLSHILLISLPHSTSIVPFQIHFHSTLFPFLCIRIRLVSFYFIFIRWLCVCWFYFHLFIWYIQPWSPLCTRVPTHTHLPYSCHGLFLLGLLSYSLMFFYFYNIPSK